MTDPSKLLHLAASILWLGGIGFMMLALRPAAATLPPPLRLPFMVNILRRFFAVVWVAVALLLLTGFHSVTSVGLNNAPLGWHLMMGFGTLMCLIFAHLYFGPFRRLKQAAAQANWPEGGRRMGQIATLATLNFAVGWIAIAAVLLVK